MSAFDNILDWIAARIVGVVRKPSSGYEPFTPSDPECLRSTLKPGDVLLVEGNQKVSAAIKYLTQSTWSHAAIYVGDILRQPEHGDNYPCLIEANVGRGVEVVPLSHYETFNTRICRAVNLSEADRETLVDYVVNRIGDQYDTRNIFDLARYLFPLPPVPIRWRRRMLSIGSGDPSRAICSTMIAEAFQKIQYPILPLISDPDNPDPQVRSYYSRREIMHIRHYSLFAPRDFDVSPFFQIVKPTIAAGFDYKSVTWGAPHHGERGSE
ncbi:MAG: hypothetical protein K8F25_09420 [Fimbriimonadaceae bacterium]|nr:hypothetical protein [Alphaproteobacteria bacterium]